MIPWVTKRTTKLPFITANCRQNCHEDDSNVDQEIIITTEQRQNVEETYEDSYS